LSAAAAGTQATTEAVLYRLSEEQGNVKYKDLALSSWTWQGKWEGFVLELYDNFSGKQIVKPQDLNLFVVKTERRTFHLFRPGP